MSDDDLVSILLKDENYYKKGGGVTFSGGEFLLHVEEYKEVLNKKMKFMQRNGNVLTIKDEYLYVQNDIILSFLK